MTDKGKMIAAVNRRLEEMNIKEIEMVLKFIFALVDFREVTK